MKRQDILEIIVSNPLAIFTNGNTASGKFSEYPRYFQITGMTNDKSYVRVKGIFFKREDFLKTEDGSEYVKDEAGKMVQDARPISERCTVTYRDDERMPTRLVLKSENTEEGMLAEFVEMHERGKREADQREEQHEQFTTTRAELANILFSLDLVDETKTITDQWRHRECNVDFNQAQMVRLISVLKSAMTQMVGV